MDHDEFPELDRLLTRARGPALRSLATIVDVEQRLRNIRRTCDANRDADADTTPPRDRKSGGEEGGLQHGGRVYPLCVAR